MKKLLNKIWSKLDGYKTYLGVGLHLVWFIVNIAKKDLSTTSEAVIGHTLIGTITGTGLGHKFGKSDKGKKIIEDAKKKIKKQQ